MIDPELAGVKNVTGEVDDKPKRKRAVRKTKKADE